MPSGELLPRGTHEVAVLSDAVLVTLHGEFDLSTAADLAAWLHQALLDHPGLDLHVEASDVSFLDSSGIRALLRSQNEAAAQGRGFRLIGAQGTVREVLEIVDVYDLLTGHQPTSG